MGASRLEDSAWFNETINDSIVKQSLCVFKWSYLVLLCKFTFLIQIWWNNRFANLFLVSLERSNWLFRFFWVQKLVCEPFPRLCDPLILPLLVSSRTLLLVLVTVEDWGELCSQISSCISVHELLRDVWLSLFFIFRVADDRERAFEILLFLLLFSLLDGWLLAIDVVYFLQCAEWISNLFLDRLLLLLRCACLGKRVMSVHVWVSFN